MSITDELAVFAADLEYDDIPPETVRRAKQILVDTIGAAVGGRRAGSTPSVLATVDDLDETGEGATVLATGAPRSPAYAALANGALAHSLDFDETHRAGSVHAAASVLAGVLAAGEAADADGRDLLTAFVAGYEITARLGTALNSEAHYAKGFHATSTCGVYGAAAAAARVRDGSAAAIETVFGVNGSQSAGTLQFLDDGGWNKRIHPGLAAHSGYLATRFAANDFAAVDEPIEGARGFLQAYSDDPEPGRALAGLGEGFEVDRAGLKPYPLCRFLHPVIDGVLEIATAEDVGPDSVRAVRVELSSSGHQLVGDPPQRYAETVVDAQFSLPFAVMLALTRREAGVDALFESVSGELTDREKRLVDATTATAAGWADDRYPDQWPAAVTVETDEGIYERRVLDARGDPETPLSWDEIREKYDSLTAPVVGEATATALRERIESIEDESARSLLQPLREATFRDPV